MAVLVNILTKKMYNNQETNELKMHHVLGRIRTDNAIEVSLR